MSFGFGFGFPKNYVAALFGPASLFANNEQGAWYDPSDFSTLFQDSAGTTPVTAVEQPVGLMLDKSKGLVLGPELVTNGDFSNGTTGWTAPVPGSAITAGALVFDGVTSIAAATTVTSNLGSTLVQGRTYKVTYTIVSDTAQPVSISINGSATTPKNLPGTYTEYITAGPLGGVSVITRYVNGARTGSIDNISVRELPGNHALQSTSANRPVLSARVNLLTKTEDFSDSVWTASKSAGASVTPNTTIAPNGTLTADTVTFASSGDYLYQAFSNYPAISGQGVTLAYYAKTTARLMVFGGASPSGNDTHSYVDAGDGWYKHTTIRTFNVTTSALTLQVLPSAGIAGSGSYPIWGADLRPTNIGVNLPAYQRVNTSTDYDTTGFPLYLKCNGTNTAMQTNSINFSATDKMTVWAGVRKLSNAAAGILMELSANTNTNAGSFYHAAPYGTGAAYFQTGARGATSAGTSDISGSLYPAPISTINTSVIDLAGASVSNCVSLKINNNTTGVSLGSAAGGGNFGNYPIYLFARNASSLFFNGNFYGAIIRGAQSSAQQIADAEKWMNNKTLAY